MRKIKIIDGNYKKEGLRIYEDICPTLNARDYKEPKMVYEIVVAQRGRGDGKTTQQLEPNYSGNTNTLTGVQKDNMIVQVKSATSSGYEEAKEGDSINYSVPNSKTRRGRVGVGVGVAQTLDTQVNQSVLLQGNIRRLTEIECERLQGFKDGHTKFGNYDGVVKEISRTQRYKMCGNAVTVDIVELIVRKLLPQDEIVLIDLFSGIGGFAEGLQRAGFKISHHYFSEIDRHAIANYKYNFPHAEYIGSVTDVSGHDIRAKHPNAKIFVTGGFPCQDISIAGKRKGLESGTRSSLLFEAGRIIDELKCEYFLIENVKGLSSINEGTGIIKTITFLTYLNSDSPQYAVDVQLFNTKWLLPQNRERYYFIGCLGTGGGRRIFPITENDFRTTEGSSDTATVRTLTGGGHSGGMHSSMTLLRV